jgi:hypothetical protein
MSSHNLTRKLEATVRQLFLGNEVADELVTEYGSDAGQNIYGGVARGEKSLPCVIITASGSSEDPPFSGIYTLACEIAVKTAFNAEDPEEDQVEPSSAIVRAVADALNSSNLEDDLNTNAVADFSVLGHMDLASSSGPSDDAWVETFNLKFICAPFAAHV